MTLSRSVLASLLASTALATVAGAAPALAQAPAGENSVDVLSDVVVTATRQSDTVNRVPLSVSAVTQKSLDQQGVKTVQDLGRTVPALSIQGNNNSMTPTLTIRGIYAQTGAATTGVYLDDTPLTKRQVSGSGGNTNGNGTPVPPLFDLERVEVLRGPQGTLYGGSSEGGTVRFITPTPSLTSYSANSRFEISATDNGAPSYEAGLAVGGPLVKDKLGIRLTPSPASRAAGSTGWTSTTTSTSPRRTSTRRRPGRRTARCCGPPSRTSASPSRVTSPATCSGIRRRASCR